MASRTGVFSTSVGTKILIGVTGLALFIYLIIHIAGNLLIFFGPEVFNNYAYTMEVRNPALPAIEIALLLVFLVHIYKTVTMFLGNQRARPARYAAKKYAGPPSRKSFASSTMIVSGLWLLAFLLVHVKAFRDLYRQEFETLSNPLVVGFYMLSMIVVGSHLWHGIASGFQSLGADHPKITPKLLVAGKVLAVLIAGGFIVIAAWVYLTQAGRVHA
jgi:succinate dehydrogenase / fumarate reductase cytochrome b subunit